MPELPEVETIRKKLDEVLSGLEISKINILKEKSFRGLPHEIINKKIKKINRRAKIVIFELDDQSYILVHLKMTGQLIFVDGDNRLGGGHPSADWVDSLPTKHTRVFLSFSNGSKLYFNDMRIFGWMKHVSNEQLDSEFSNYGPDINTDEASVNYLFDQFSRRRIPIKQAIMLNQIVAGVGNIYACDALNMAKISPFKESKTLTKNEVEILLKAMKHVIDKGIELGGATIDDYVNVEGFAGKYQSVIIAYGREGDPCYNCGEKIVKAKIGGRGTYYCEFCQIWES